MKEKLRISIVTVCYNAEKVIDKTIKSVINQSYTGIEYLIIDGASKDGTLDIIEKYAEDDRIRYISEPDCGIYDAMNKGIALATGEYLQFLNAGDTFVDNKVVASVAAKIEETSADVVYGNIIYQYPDGSTNVRVYGQFCSGLFYYILGDCINHQAVFAKKDCFQKDVFDTSYLVCADREWMIRVKKAGKRFKALNILICQYSLDEESVSIKHKDRYEKEADRCIRTHLKLGYPLFCLVNKIRRGNISAKWLHRFYTIFFLRRE